ncbi:MULTISPECIES: aldehyde-activating protein [unclassified Devosia]|uniref:GFA family protein n=1 Tax=unclassified Devosia TaxID=196773 RepID=UPI001555B8D4|nr:MULTISPECIES: aldehyde-activating protein [unclassified Devosia]
MTLVATCHCGSTRIEMLQAPTEAHECNCTLCNRVGAVWASFAPEEVRITATNDQVYSASEGVNLHHFCAKCGGNTHSDCPDWGSLYNLDGTLKPGMTDAIPANRIITVNLRMIPDFDPSSLPVSQVDGRNNW